MKKIALLASTALILFSFKAMDTATWTVDKMHSRLGFSINHLGVSDIEGSFKNFDCSITASKADFSDAVVDMSAEVNSINTEQEKRDEHLKGADFFDASKFPTLTFKSKSVKTAGGNKLKVSGDLTMHGVTKPVELEATYRSGTNPMSKKEVMGFRFTGTIKRSDFGIGTKFGAPMLGEEVMMVANGEFAKK